MQGESWRTADFGIYRKGRVILLDMSTQEEKGDVPMTGERAITGLIIGHRMLHSDEGSLSRALKTVIIMESDVNVNV